MGHGEFVFASRRFLLERSTYPSFSFSAGALNAYNCNRYDGGKKPVMRDTVYPPNSPAKEKIGEPHVLWSPLLDDQGNVVLDPLGQPVKVQKGMETILRVS